MDTHAKTCGLLNYCKMSNFVQALHNISVELSIIGLPEISAYEENNPAATVVSLVNTVWTLLRQRQRLMDEKRAIESKLLSITEEINSLKKKTTQMDRELEKSGKELAKGKNLNIALKMDNIGERKQIKCLNTEVQDLKTELKKQESKFKEVYMKQQKENFLLQEKLKDILVDYEVQKWRHSKGSNSTKPVDSTSEFDTKEKWYKKCLNRLEDNVQTLVKENLDLRKLLDELTNDLSILLMRKKQVHSVPAERLPRSATLRPDVP